MKSSFVLPFLLLVAAGDIAVAQSQGTFAPSGGMSTERMAHTATLLTNGKVLVAGGRAVLAGWPVWASAELYDPLAGRFALAGSMTTPRAGHTATLLPDGKVLIAGGFVPSGDGSRTAVLASAELYDPATSTFIATGPMTMPRQWHTATLLNTGRVLITGGNGPDLQSSAELYDPVTGTFSATGSMAAARSQHVAVLLPNGRVLIEGGGNCDSQPNPELYDPASGQFTLTGPSAYPLSWSLSAVAASQLPSGNVLITLDVGCDVGSGAEEYDWMNGTFAATAKMTTDRGYNTTTLLPEGRVLIDGRDWTHIGGSAELFDPVTGSFAAINSMFPQSEELHTATLLPDGSVLLAGGWICCGFSIAAAEIYYPTHPVPSPVLYSLPGATQGAILHAATQQVVSTDNPAVAGEALEIFGTGLIDGSVIPPQVAVGGRMAEVLFFGNAPGYPGLNQINLRVPSGVAAGTAIPVRLNYLSRPSNEVTLAIQ